jgi:hypothetical protein
MGPELLGVFRMRFAHSGDNNVAKRLTFFKYPPNILDARRAPDMDWCVILPPSAVKIKHLAREGKPDPVFTFAKFKTIR